jgi:hypothetical protein
LEPEELFHLYNCNDSGAYPQYKDRILAIFRHPLFKEVLEKLPAASQAVLTNILVCGGVLPALLPAIRSIPLYETGQPRFIRILFNSDWSDFEAATDFVLSEIELGLQLGHML